MVWIALTLPPGCIDAGEAALPGGEFKFVDVLFSLQGRAIAIGSTNTSRIESVEKNKHPKPSKIRERVTNHRTLFGE